ncbi:MAG TPA: ATPase domain-containing protein [Acidimicrobiales bacterium]
MPDPARAPGQVVPAITGRPLSELAMSHMADNVVLLQHLHIGREMKRALTVLKTRGASHTSAVREFRITSEGITLAEPLDVEALLR